MCAETEPTRKQYQTTLCLKKVDHIPIIMTTLVNVDRFSYFFAV